MFDNLPPGIRLASCEPEEPDLPANPDRYYEARIERELDQEMEDR